RSVGSARQRISLQGNRRSDESQLRHGAHAHPPHLRKAARPLSHRGRRQASGPIPLPPRTRPLELTLRVTPEYWGPFRQFAQKRNLIRCAGQKMFRLLAFLAALATVPLARTDTFTKSDNALSLSVLLVFGQLSSH